MTTPARGAPPRVPGRRPRGRAATRLAAVAMTALATTAGGATGACLAIDASRDQRALARVDLPSDSPVFTVTYIHSVTRTPVEERYRVDGATIVQESIRFEEHGPGLPTQADPGGGWRRDAKGTTVTMHRGLDSIAMRVDADQRPRLAHAAATAPLPLTQWDEGAIRLSARPGACADSVGAGASTTQ
ncbi:MAG: DUF1850 domain-containing protein [Burkholderiales bacterium]